MSSFGFGSAVLSSGVSGCFFLLEHEHVGEFLHGVASGDPLSDRVILWTRVTPVGTDPITVAWQVATDADFTDVVVEGECSTDGTRDWTVKVDAAGLSASTIYYYRFKAGDADSAIGTTRTLPEGAVDQVKLVVFSCSNYPAGYFHVYREALATADVDAAVHLGDYLYEYGSDGYATEDAAALDREVEPAGEILTLADYRTRHAQYRTDPDLQAIHAALPFFTVWDDHEIANDAWTDGAENHDGATEGNWEQRRDDALQAYAEWMPLRPPVDTDLASLQRSFHFGELVHLVLLDTRIAGRDEQLSLGQFVDPGTGVFDAAAYAAAVGDPARTLLGAPQLAWLQTELVDTSTWQVLGQQVLMATMELPVALLPTDLSDPTSAPLTLEEFTLLVTLATIAGRIAAGDPTVTAEDIQLLTDNQQFLDDNAFWLTAGTLPYNLDAWDGYPAERTTVLQTAIDNAANLVVLAGDTHNAWASDLVVNGTPAGVELATSSVSSPGLEEYLGLTLSPDPDAAAAATEAGFTTAIPTLRYANLLQRGWLTVTFTAATTTAEWTYVDSVKDAVTTVRADRTKVMTVTAGTNQLD
jgi:alkaline phosphatase D